MAICDKKLYFVVLVSTTVLVYVVISVLRNKETSSKQLMVPSTRVGHSQHSPAAGYIARMTISKRGRLGNNLFQYAAVKGLASLTGRQPVLTLAFINPLEAFHVDIGFVQESALNDTTWRVYDTKTNRLDIKRTIRSIASVNKSENILLRGYFHSHLYFDNIRRSLRQELVFKEDIQQAANTFLSRAIIKENVTTVGIHLRLGDKRYWEDRGFFFPPTGYFRKAMDYFTSRYDVVHFVVSSDETIVASRKVLPSGFDYSFVRKESVYLDLAILTSCHHIIISRGTFSWWAGWLNKGITVYFPYNGANGSDTLLDSSCIPRDEYNHWIPM